MLNDLAEQNLVEAVVRQLRQHLRVPEVGPQVQRDVKRLRVHLRQLEGRVEVDRADLKSVDRAQRRLVQPMAADIEQAIAAQLRPGGSLRPWSARSAASECALAVVDAAESDQEGLQLVNIRMR